VGGSRGGTGGTVTGGSTSTGGTVTGGTSAVGGRGGTVTGGTSAVGGRDGTVTGGATGTGGATSPFGGGGSTGGTSAAGGRGGAGGTTGGAGGATGGASGGAGGRGGAGGTTSTSTAPTGSLQVYLTSKTASGATGQLSLDFRIDNQTSASVDLSNVTLRYWYQDEGWVTTSLTLEVDYKSLSGDNVTGGKAVAASPSTAGADHYVELSFSGTVAAKGPASGADQFAANIRLHSSTWVGTVDVTNDYSYDGGATGLYEKKITLYSGGKLIWGTEP
jgi:hypothetical protein